MMIVEPADAMTNATGDLPRERVFL